MSEHALTQEERRCLQLWFRQAIAEVEKNEVSAQLMRRHAPTATHRAVAARRHAVHVPGHRKELVLT